MLPHTHTHKKLSFVKTLNGSIEKKPKKTKKPMKMSKYRSKKKKKFSTSKSQTKVP